MKKFIIKKTIYEKSPTIGLRKRILTICFLVFGVLGLSAQNAKTITGTILDETKEPLTGVAVSVKGTTNGVISDIDGTYSIKAKSGDKLVFSFIGTEPQEITVASQSKIDVVMVEDSKMLAETVVIGYGSAKKVDLTGSITSISAADIANRPSSNALSSLQGKVAGMQVINSGRAGADPDIRIRGVNSINGYGPLYVVDGLFTDNINFLNSADIESMEVLKDPSSLAIFGVRGANGVIIISTKRAKTGQTVVNINASVGFKNVEKRMKMTNAAQFKELYAEQLANTPNSTPFDFSKWQADTDWQDEAFHSGFVTNNNVSIAGSSDKNKFYLGIGYQSDGGLIKDEKFSRVTVNLSSDYEVKPFLRFGYQFNGSRTLPADAKNVDGLLKATPIAPVYSNWTNPKTGLVEQLYTAMPDFQKAQVANPMIDIEYKARHNKATNYRATGNIYGEVNFLKDFKFRATFSLDYQGNDSRRYDPSVYVYNVNTANKELFKQNQEIVQEKVTDINVQADYVLTYTKQIGLHGITGTAGITTSYKDYSMLNAGRNQIIGNFEYPIPNDNPDKWWISSIDKNSATNNGDQYRRFTMSYLVRGLYNYNNRYLLNASYRRDGSSVFRNMNNTWDNFYSVGAGWVLSEESFMQNQSIVEYLKLKGSWGILGSQNIIGDLHYPSYPQLTADGSAIFGDPKQSLPAYSLVYLVNGLDLRWEKTHSWEIGFDARFLNGRLSFSPTFYSKKTKDILVLLSGQGGAKNSLQNMGEVENRGFEIAASWSDNIGSSDFRYSIGGNFTTLRNRVMKLGDTPGYATYAGTQQVSRSMAGLPIGSFYGYKVKGVYQNYEQIAQSPKSKLPVAPGDLIFEDINNDGVIDEKDRTEIGNPNPDFTYGLNLNLSYKGFDLGVDMMGVYGNEIYRAWYRPTFATFNYQEHHLNRWHGEGTSNWEPILDPSRAVNQQNSSYNIEDGSFFRIRNVQLGYTFNPSILKKLYLQNLRIYVNIENLKTWTADSQTGFNPEITGSALSSGIDDGTYPMPRTFTFGVNLTF